MSFDYEGQVTQTILMTGVMDLIDRWFIDGIVNGVRHVTIGLCVVSKVFDVGVIDMLVNLAELPRVSDLCAVLSRVARAAAA